MVFKVLITYSCLESMFLYDRRIIKAARSAWIRYRILSNFHAVIYSVKTVSWDGLKKRIHVLYVGKKWRIVITGSTLMDPRLLMYNGFNTVCWNKKRQLQGLNLRGNIPSDFKSDALTTRPNWLVRNDTIILYKERSNSVLSLSHNAAKGFTY